jgi:hypothetical protein
MLLGLLAACRIHEVEMRHSKTLQVVAVLCCCDHPMRHLALQATTACRNNATALISQASQTPAGGHQMNRPFSAYIVSDILLEGPLEYQFFNRLSPHLPDICTYQIKFFVCWTDVSRAPREMNTSLRF